MATTLNHFVSAMLVFVLLITLSLNFTAGQIGVCYGRNGNNLLSPRDVVQLYKRHNIRRMRTFDPDYAVLDALRGSGIELSVVITNQFLENLARNQNAANDWVRNHVTNYRDVNYKYISVGNEVSPADGATSRFARFVLPAILNIYRAVYRAGLDARVKITTTVSTSVLGNSFPPEAGAFRDDVVSFLRPILSFAAYTGAPFMANIYPYFAYINNKDKIDLGYALLEENHGIQVNGVYYDNLFYAMVDAMYAAMDRIAPLSKTAGRGGYNYNVTAELKGRRRPFIVRGDTGHPYLCNVTADGGCINYNVKPELKGRRRPFIVRGDTGHPHPCNVTADGSCDNYNVKPELKGRRRPFIVRGDTGHPYPCNVTADGGCINYNVKPELKGRRRPFIVRGDTGHPHPCNVTADGSCDNYNVKTELKGRRRRGTLKLIIGETGYPSKGGDSANMQYAKTYNQNLIEVVDNGTPRNPEPIETYLFALFDENEKPGPETERNFGLFYPNGQPKYDINFN